MKKRRGLAKSFKDGVLGSRANKQMPGRTSGRVAQDKVPGKRLLCLACAEPGNGAMIPGFLDLMGYGKKFCFHFLSMLGNTEVT